MFRHGRRITRPPCVNAALYCWARAPTRPQLKRRAEDAVSGCSLQAQAVIEELSRFEQD